MTANGNDDSIGDLDVSMTASVIMDGMLKLTRDQHPLAGPKVLPKAVTLVARVLEWITSLIEGLPVDASETWCRPRRWGSRYRFSQSDTAGVKLRVR